MWVSETYVNATKGYGFGDSEPQEAFTDDAGQLYRALRKEYGRCVSKVYIDDKDAPGGAKAIGWVFVKRMAYEDARSKADTYLREVWVSLHDAPTTVTRTPHYHAI